MLVRLLSPFVRTYRKLGLQNKWWHRFSIVCLLLSVAGAFALTLALTLWPDVRTHKTAVAPPAAAPEKTEHGPWEQYAQITNFPSLPKGYSAVVILSGQGERIQFPADTTRGELMKTLCDHLKQADAACWEVVSESPAAPQAGHTDNAKSPGTPPAFWRLIARDIGMAFAVSLGLNWLLQFAYRALIFIVFGTAPSNRVDI